LRILKVLKATRFSCAESRFTHHDPLEDTERTVRRAYEDECESFTHHDPLEDTERLDPGLRAIFELQVSPITIRLRILKGENSFAGASRTVPVSPITIRLRILKERHSHRGEFCGLCFTHHDPLEDTESPRRRLLRQRRAVSPITIRLRILKGEAAKAAYAEGQPRFTHHDPLEDTERRRSEFCSLLITQVSPITIRLRILKANTNATLVFSSSSFTHHDPLEDTESAGELFACDQWGWFHPSRSA